MSLQTLRDGARVRRGLNVPERCKIHAIQLLKSLMLETTYKVEIILI